MKKVDVRKPFGHLEYLPNFTQDFWSIVPELQGVDIYIYGVIACNINNFVDWKTKRLTAKEIAELSGKSIRQVYNSINHLTAARLPSGKPVMIKDRDMFIFPDFRMAHTIRIANEQAQRRAELAQRAYDLLEKKAAELEEFTRDRDGNPREFHIDRLKNEIIEELNLDFNPFEQDAWV